MKSVAFPKRFLVLFLCVGILASLCSHFCISANAAATFTMSASAVSDNKFTVTVTFPATSWNTFLFEISYNQNVIQASDATHSSGAMLISNSAAGNSTGKYKVNGLSAEPISTASTLTIPFSVKDTSASSVTITLSITDFANGSTQIERTAPAPLTITLKTQASTDGGSGSTSSTTDTPSVSTSTTTNTTTDTNTTSSKTDTNTTTKTDTNTTTKTNSTTKTSGTVTSSTTSDTGTEPDVTDSEELTDTETNFPLSDSDSDTDVDTDVSDTSDTTTVGSTSTQTVSSVVTSSLQETPKKEISTGMIALISVGIAVVLCGALTVVGLLRHKKD